MYEKSVRAEHVQKVMSEAMYNFIDENKLQILGSPMANNEKTPSIDWDNQTDFTFYVDIAMQPEFELNLTDKNVTYYDINPTDEMLNNFVEDIQGRFAKFKSPETVAENDWVYGERGSLNEKAMVKKGEIK